jgi:hypothetical protein
MRNSERGQALPLALLVLAAGTLIIAPFLSHASSNLIGSRIYGQVITEQYSCDAGVEWALWRLTENPVLTTNTNYHTTSLQPFPNEINGSSFPTTEIRFVESDRGSIGTITPEWQDGKGWHDYPISQVTFGTLTVVINNITASQDVQIRLKNPSRPPQHFQGDGPYIADFEIDDPSTLCTVQVKLPKETKYGPLEPGPITITIIYPTGIGGTGATETIIPEWLTGSSWVSYPFRATDAGFVMVVVACDAPIVRIQLYGAPGPPGSSPYTAAVGPLSPGQPDQEIQVQIRTYDEKGHEIPYYGPGTIIITYPIASYDIRAQKGDRTTTVRTTASYLATRVISWQIE